MCRILAITDCPKTEKKTALLKSYRGLAETGKVPKGLPAGHKDGWGFGFYKGGRFVKLIKTANGASRDKSYQKAINQNKENDYNLIIGNLRKAFIGKNKKKNSQPFRRGNYVFTHNGTTINHDKIPLTPRYQKMRKGDTDSEKFFLYILQLIETKKLSPKMALKKAVAFAQKHLYYTALNIIFSDGKKLYALREINLKNKEVIELKLKDYYTLYIGKYKDRSTVICSEKIDRIAKWRPLKNHEMIETSII